MNLVDFISQHETIGDIKLIAQGFQSSPYYFDNAGIDVLLKELLTIFLEKYGNLRKKTINQNTNGGIQKILKGSKATTKEQGDKKLSYCVEFKQTLNNIIGLIGYEFSHCLFALFGLKKILKNHIDNILVSTSYKEILYYATIVKNIYFTKDKSLCIISDTFESPFMGYGDNGMVSLTEEINTTTYNYFRRLLKRIHYDMTNNDIVNFPEVKSEIHKELTKLYAHTIFDNYVIETVEQLCINLGKYKPCYDSYFIKIWEVLFRETYADVFEKSELYPQFNVSTKTVFIPFVDYLNKEYTSNEIKINKYLSTFVNYFIKIYNDTLKVFVSDDFVRVSVTTQFYEHLATITMNLFINMANEIAKNQSSCMFFGKSTRVQFIQIFHALQECCPKLYIYSESQLGVLHYILLQKDVLTQSINITKQSDVKQNKRKPNT